MENYTPIILEEQQKIVEWARDLQVKKYISLPTAIEFLVSNGKVNSKTYSEGLEEVREIYKKYNSGWKEQVLKALVLDRYRLDFDIKEGQSVTDGDRVGVAFKVDYKNRLFDLHSSTEGDAESYIGTLSMNNFHKIG